jgi:hypothetical protein
MISLNIPQKILIVDGDDIVEKVCSGFSAHGLKKMLEIFELEIKAIGQKCGYELENIIIALSCEHNFRKRFFPKHKPKRNIKEKKNNFKELKVYLGQHKEKFSLLQINEMMSTDCMAIAGTNNQPGISVYTKDDDIKTITVRQWDFEKDEFWKPTENQAMACLYNKAVDADENVQRVKEDGELISLPHELAMIEQVFIWFWLFYKDIETAKSKMCEKLAEVRIIHKVDYDDLLEENKTFDPFDILSIGNEKLQFWLDRYMHKRQQEK